MGSGISNPSLFTVEEWSDSEGEGASKTRFLWCERYAFCHMIWWWFHLQGIQLAMRKFSLPFPPLFLKFIHTFSNYFLIPTIFEALGRQHKQWRTIQTWSPLSGSPEPCGEIDSKHTLNIHWKDWCWSWSFNTLATWCHMLTHWKRPRCWERLRARR